MFYANVIGFAIWMAHDGDDQGGQPTSHGSRGREEQRAVSAPTA
jgi:hypothetical protein